MEGMKRGGIKGFGKGLGQVLAAAASSALPPPHRSHRTAPRSHQLPVGVRQHMHLVAHAWQRLAWSGRGASESAPARARA
jgi:hypothetical protein